MIDYKRKTRKELEDEANAISWETHYHQVMMRLHPHSDFEFGDLSQTGEALYDEINPYQLAGEDKVYDTKLPWADVLTEVSDYRSDELQKIDRVYRGLDLWNWGQAMHDTGIYDNSLDFDDFLKRVMKGSEFDLLSLENADSKTRQKFEFKAAVQERRKKMEVGQECIATVNYLNDLKNATDIQVNAQLNDSDIKLIMQSLQTGSLARAKSMIEAKDLTDLEPMDQSYKDEVVKLIDDYMGA